MSTDTAELQRVREEQIRMGGKIDFLQQTVDSLSKNTAKLSNDILTERDARKDAINEILDSQRKAERYWMVAGLLFLANAMFDKLWANVSAGGVS